MQAFEVLSAVPGVWVFFFKASQAGQYFCTVTEIKSLVS